MVGAIGGTSNVSWGQVEVVCKQTTTCIGTDIAMKAQKDAQKESELVCKTTEECTTTETTCDDSMCTTTVFNSNGNSKVYSYGRPLELIPLEIK